MKFTENLEHALELLHKKGAFLTTKADEKVNSMTISWGDIGFKWNKPIFIVMVRGSRYTYELIEKSDNFTVSIPKDVAMTEALKFCGTKSGRDYNKYQECGLELIDAKAVETPVISGGGYTYECKIVYKAPLVPNLMTDEIKKGFYSNNDYHTLYFGEIVECYEN